MYDAHLQAIGSVHFRNVAQGVPTRLSRGDLHALNLSAESDLSFKALVQEENFKLVGTLSMEQQVVILRYILSLNVHMF